MLPEVVKASGRRVFQPLVTLLVNRSVPPNLLTWSGLLLSAGAGGLLSRGIFRAAGVAAALGGVCDILDGEVARSSRKVTDYGKFIDSVVDRYSEFIILLGPFVYYLSRSPGLALLTLLAIFGSFMVSYARARAEGLGQTCNIGILDRPGRMVLIILGALSGPRYFHFFLGALVVLSHFTSIQRIVWVWRRVKGQEVVENRE